MDEITKFQEACLLLLAALLSAPFVFVWGIATVIDWIAKKAAI
jgi:hypothetical protein